MPYADTPLPGEAAWFGFEFNELDLRCDINDSTWLGSMAADAPRFPGSFHYTPTSFEKKRVIGVGADR